MAADGSSGDRMPGQRMGSSGFQWVALSPSPEEVARLESTFPEVVKVPESELVAEMADWQGKAILARSYQRWIPAAAFIREFRYAGVQGEIEPISLAFRCHVFRFADPKAVDLVLNRPWVINGQVAGMEPWKPEFIPAEDAIPYALLWMRLPNLPLEFWKEDILRVITAAAGSFVCADPPTMARSRGGFARICLRVDLRRPLRPGTRMQGVHLPFWQQFTFENLDGICSACGSLHLSGPCSVPVDDGENGVPTAPLFGPWLAALRQRRAPSGSQRQERQPPQPKAPSATVSQRRSAASREGGAEAGGWSSPVKVARRRLPPSMMVVSSPVSGSVVNVAGAEKAVPGKVKGIPGVPVVPRRTECLKLQSSVSAASSQLVPIQIQLAKNPFESLQLGSSDGDQMANRVGGPGPLKRARPVDCQAPRSFSKAEKKKGKIKNSQPKSIGTKESRVVEVIKPVMSDGLTVKDSTVMNLGFCFGSTSLIQSCRQDVPEGESEGMGSSMLQDRGSPSRRGPPDMCMAEDQGGVPVPPTL